MSRLSFIVGLLSLLLIGGIHAEDRETLIDKVHLCCITGFCSEKDLGQLKADVKDYLRVQQDDGLQSLTDKLLFGTHDCARPRSMRDRRSDAATAEATAATVLEHITIPPINIFEITRTAHIVASAGNGISWIYMFGQNATNYAGYAYVTFDDYPASINTTFVFLSENWVGDGIFNLSVTIADEDGEEVTFTSQELAARNLQSTIVYAGSGCAAGFYKPFGLQGACKVCPVGSYSKKEAFVCSYCPAGQGVVSNGTACKQCAAGTYSTGTTPCKACPAGTSSQAAGSYVCTPCPAGAFSAAGAQWCAGCPDGTYSRYTQSTACKPCPAGTFTNGMGSSACTDCRPGTYSSSVGATSASVCKLCPEGTFNGVSGAASCTSCPTGSISSEGSTSTLKCFAT